MQDLTTKEFASLVGVFFFVDKFGDVLGSDRRLFSHKEVCIKPEVVSNFNEEFKDYIIKD